MITQSPVYDVLIVGAGPGGAMSAMLAARAGLRVVLVEKESFPRFHIGESLLPRTVTQLRDLGVLDSILELPHVPKFGAEFVMGDNSCGEVFDFENGMLRGESQTFNIERALLDQRLLELAIAAGAEHLTCTAPARIQSLEEGAAAIEVDGRTLHGRVLLDASGQSTLVGRYLGLRKRLEAPYLQKAAYFQHFTGVRRLPGRRAGHPCIAMCEEGWFWIIPINDTITSVGLVAEPRVCREAGIAANRMLAWGIERTPVIRERMAQAQGPETNHVAGDFSYTCQPYAGPGYFLVGDAATFLDPVFSSGVYLALSSAERAVQAVVAMQQGRRPGPLRSDYIRFVRSNSRVFLWMIERYYRHAFRELFLHGRGPAQLQRAVVATTSGNACPNPPWKIQWRLWLFDLCMHLQRHLALVPRREVFSLLHPQKAGGTA